MRYQVCCVLGGGGGGPPACGPAQAQRLGAPKFAVPTQPAAPFPSDGGEEQGPPLGGRGGRFASLGGQGDSGCALGCTSRSGLSVRARGGSLRCSWSASSGSTFGGSRLGHPVWGRAQGGSSRCSRGARSACALRLPAWRGARGAPEVRARGLRSQKLGEPLSWGALALRGGFPLRKVVCFRKWLLHVAVVPGGSALPRRACAPRRAAKGGRGAPGFNLGGGPPSALGGFCGVTARPVLCHGGDTGGLRACSKPLALGALAPCAPRPAAHGVPLPVAHRRRTSPLPAPCWFSAACGHLRAIPRGRGSSRGCRCRETACGEWWWFIFP